VQKSKGDRKVNCHEINRILETKDADDLGVTEKSAIDRHLASCETCQGAWASFAEIASELIPAISPELHSRIDQLIAARLPSAPESMRRTFIAGSILALGVAAATIVFQVGDREREVAVTPAPGLPTAESLSPSEPEIMTFAEGLANDDAGTNLADSGSGAVPAPITDALDPRSLVVIADPGSNADTETLSKLDECHRGIVARLREIPGLNVIAGVAVTAFQNSGLTNEEIARELGAGSVLVLDDLAVCNFKLADSRTGAFIAGRVLATALVTAEEGLTFDTDNLDWDRFYDGLAQTVNDTLLTEEAELIAEAQATFLNTSLGEDERLAALYRTTSSTRSLPDAILSQAVIAALAQIMTTSPDPQNRRTAVLSVRGLYDAVLIDPLLYALNYDAETEVRRIAAGALHEYVSEPRVREALLNIIAEDRSDNPSIICCQGGLGEAARRALATDDELQALSLQQLRNTELTDFLRLQVLVDYLDREVGYLYRPDEVHSDVVFSIGRNSGDSTVRSRAWSVLARGAQNPAYVPTLLDDLSAHGDEDVRHSAAQALTQYADDAGVRAALERALETDACDCLRTILEPVLQAE
jgi:hypothetical protein